MLVTERGATFGYNNLVVDMRGFAPDARGGPGRVLRRHPLGAAALRRQRRDGGERKYVALLARAAAAVGIDALFTEVHEDPDTALCDGPCSLTPQMFEERDTQCARHPPRSGARAGG